MQNFLERTDANPLPATAVSEQQFGDGSIKGYPSEGFVCEGKCGLFKREIPEFCSFCQKFMCKDCYNCHLGDF